MLFNHVRAMRFLSVTITLTDTACFPFKRLVVINISCLLFCYVSILIFLYLNSWRKHLDRIKNYFSF